MPANLGPDYLNAEQDYRQAQSREEKIAALERMWATLPKHKGTEKLQAELKRKLSQTRKEVAKKGATRSTPFYQIPKEGAGQIALAGPPNSGKSSLLATLTHAHPETGAYPFTTRLPLPGMMEFGHVLIQLVDLPPISGEFTEQWLPQVLRSADALLMVLDVNDPASLDEIEFIESALEEWRVPRPKLIAANKCDVKGEKESIAVLADLYRGRYKVLAVSAMTGEGLDALRRELFDLLSLVRVYTKSPGKQADLTAPYVLKRGETVLDAARHVHRDFADHLKYARLFRLDGNHDGMLVDRNQEVHDEDILEFHL